jgi:hypothetical protein
MLIFSHVIIIHWTQDLELPRNLYNYFNINDIKKMDKLQTNAHLNLSSNIVGKEPPQSSNFQ